MLNTFQQQFHAMIPEPSHDERSRQEFAKSFKQFIQADLLPGLYPSYAAGTAKFEQQNGRPPADRREVRQFMVEKLGFQTYASANRVAQELLWESVVTSIERQHDQLNAKAAELSASAPSKLRIDTEFTPPRYVTALDIHCMPGGYANESAPNDVAVGALYDRGVYLYAMGYMGPTNDDMGRSVCNYVRRRIPSFTPRDILDLGCTVGHSTLPYKEAWPEANVTGIDVGAPVLRYAHARAQALNAAVNFEQRDATETGYEDASFDLIVSHILLHETSAKAMPQVFDECYRLLRPGGIMIHADLPPFDHTDLFSEFILDNETHYNNEPFWGAMRDKDQIAMAIAAGFDKEAIYFDTAPMAVLEFAAANASGYDDDNVAEVADRDFEAGEFAPGGGWEVLVARKQEQE
ncbi:MAG: class I SAM-dependent methyltransferase [Pseudomonadota bacterium]